MDPSVWIFEPIRWLWVMAVTRPVVAAILLAVFVAGSIMATQLWKSKHDHTT